MLVYPFKVNFSRSLLTKLRIGKERNLGSVSGKRRVFFFHTKRAGFRKGRSCTDAIFTVQQIIEKRKEHNLPLLPLFVDQEKAYDNVNREKLWEVMDNKIPNYLLNTIKCIYRNTKIRIKFNDGISEPIHINKEVREGCGLTLVLFNIYINEIIQEFKSDKEGYTTK